MKQKVCNSYYIIQPDIYVSDQCNTELSDARWQVRFVIGILHSLMNQAEQNSRKRLHKNSNVLEKCLFIQIVRMCGLSRNQLYDETTFSATFVLLG